MRGFFAQFSLIVQRLVLGVVGDRELEWLLKGRTKSPRRRVSSPMTSNLWANLLQLDAEDVSKLYEVIYAAGAPKFQGFRNTLVWIVENEAADTPANRLLRDNGDAWRKKLVGEGAVDKPEAYTRSKHQESILGLLERAAPDLAVRLTTPRDERTLLWRRDGRPLAVARVRVEIAGHAYRLARGESVVLAEDEVMEIVESVDRAFTPPMGWDDLPDLVRGALHAMRAGGDR